MAQRAAPGKEDPRSRRVAIARRDRTRFAHVAIVRGVASPASRGDDAEPLPRAVRGGGAGLLSLFDRGTGVLVDWCPMKVVVYVPARHERRLREEGKDPAVWVRSMIRMLLNQREKK